MDIVLDVVDGIVAFVVGVFQRLFSDAAYQDGFLHAVVLGGAVLLLNGGLNYAWSRILKFFSSTKAPPAPTAGPSPAEQIGGCFGGLIVLVILAAVLLMFAIRIVTG